MCVVAVVVAVALTFDCSSLTGYITGVPSNLSGVPKSASQTSQHRPQTGHGTPTW